MADRLVATRLPLGDHVHDHGALLDLQDRALQRGDESAHAVVLPGRAPAAHHRLHSQVFPPLLRRVQSRPLIARAVVQGADVPAGAASLHGLRHPDAVPRAVLGGALAQQQHPLAHDARPVVRGAHRALRVPARVHARVRLSGRGEDPAAHLPVHLRHGVRDPGSVLHVRVPRGTLADSRGQQQGGRRESHDGRRSHHGRPQHRHHHHHRHRSAVHAHEFYTTVRDIRRAGASAAVSVALVGLAVLRQTGRAGRLRSPRLGRQPVAVSAARETDAAALGALGLRSLPLRQLHVHGEHGRRSLPRYMQHEPGDSELHHANGKAGLRRQFSAEHSARAFEHIR